LDFIPVGSIPTNNSKPIQESAGSKKSKNETLISFVKRKLKKDFDVNIHTFKILPKPSQEATDLKKRKLKR
jgi:hypothetical protein